MVGLKKVCYCYFGDRVNTASHTESSVTGHCVAGVVGLKMTCSCYFGDRVNTASRTESSVELFHIHKSEATCNLLNRLRGYYCEEMGLTHIKVLFLTGLFYVAIYGIIWPVCSIHPQNFVKSHAFTTGKTAV